jgi:hypothetical protein
MQFRLRAILLATLALALLPAVSQAGLIGDTVFIRWAYPTFGESYSGPEAVVVGPGIEVDCPGPFALCLGYGSHDVSIDVDDTSITHTHSASGLSQYSTVSYNGFAYTSLDLGGAGITGFSLITNMAGLDLSRISFGVDFLNVNLQGLLIDVGSFYTVQLQSDPVPEPATVFLIAGGLLGLARTRRRR